VGASEADVAVKQIAELRQRGIRPHGGSAQTAENPLAMPTFIQRTRPTSQIAGSSTAAFGTLVSFALKCTVANPCSIAAREWDSIAQRGATSQ
jgi:hypothetical protein